SSWPGLPAKMCVPSCVPLCDKVLTSACESGPTVGGGSRFRAGGGGDIDRPLVGIRRNRSPERVAAPRRSREDEQAEHEGGGQQGGERAGVPGPLGVP